MLNLGSLKSLLDALVALDGQLCANVTIAATTIMGYGAMAGIIGGGGLGKIAINYGYYRFNVVLEFFATALLVVLVQILQTVGTKLAIKCDKRIQK